MEKRSPKTTLNHLSESRPPLFACLTAVLLMLAGCGHQEGNRVPEGSTPRTSPSGPIPVRDSIPAVDSTSATGAVAWIRDYYEAINGRRYHDAYAHWEQEGQASGKS